MSETNEKKKEDKERCFVIMPISDQGDYPSGHFTKVYEQIIKPSVEDAGYEAYRVDENNICDTIINKIFSAIQECPMAICDLSNRNPNVLYELGLRQAYDKPVVLIQDDKTEKIFDVSGIATVYYKSTRLYENVIEARENIKKAILATKEGKVNTFAKIMKASAADFSQIEVSQEDKTNMILEGIYNEIRELKIKDQENLHPNRISLRNKSISFDTSSWEKNVQISMFFICNSLNAIEQFKAELAKIDGLSYYKSEKCDENTWLFEFYFGENISIGKMNESILKIARELNIKFKKLYIPG